MSSYNFSEIAQEEKIIKTYALWHEINSILIPTLNAGDKIPDYFYELYNTLHSSLKQKLLSDEEATLKKKTYSKYVV